jgi:Abortive infection C-terminus
LQSASHARRADCRIHGYRIAPFVHRAGRGDPRAKIEAALSKEGLSYERGGRIMGASLSAPSRSLSERIAAEGIKAVEIEYDRAYKSIESDPEAAVTAVCSILESVCKVYLEKESPSAMPSKQVLGPLWGATAEHLGLSPKLVADNDLKRILQGLYSIADGVAALRTHEGSAHGRSTKSYRLASRHARLAVHAAHTMALFILETWEARRKAIIQS